MMSQRAVGIAICVTLALFALISLPFALSSYYIELTTKIVIFALFAMSLDLLLGYTGLVSLGHAAFFGISAYTIGLLLTRLEVSHWIAIPAALAAAAMTGALFGALALRARGSYFLMITLALAQVLWGIAFGWRSLTRGDDGIPDIPRPDLSALGFSFADTVPRYYAVLLIVSIATLLLVCIVKSPFGYALRGIRESESRMLALGYNAWFYKFIAFVLAAIFAGLAGCLYVYHNRFVGPEYLSIVRSAEVLIMLILGGAGTLIGPAIGAALIIFLEDFISSWTERWLMALGLIYVVVTLFAPKGLVGLWMDFWQRNSRS